MWMVLQHEKPEDFVIGTGEVHSVREFSEKAFQHVGISIVYVQSKQSLLRTWCLTYIILMFLMLLCFVVVVVDVVVSGVWVKNNLAPVFSFICFYSWSLCISGPHLAMALFLWSHVFWHSLKKLNHFLFWTSCYHLIKMTRISWPNGACVDSKIIPKCQKITMAIITKILIITVFVVLLLQEILYIIYQHNIIADHFVCLHLSQI